MSNNSIPLFRRGDIGGMSYAITNNIVNYLIVIATLSGVLGWPDEIVFGFVVPGMSIGLMAGGLVYAYMAYRLHKKEGVDVTALPSGISTPAMFVILYGVIMPLSFSLKDPKLAWSAGMAACFLGGMIEFAGGFIGPWMKSKLPRAALLGTVAGIGFIWMATQGVFSIFADPIVGMPVMFVAILGVFGGYLFPKKIPPIVVAIIGGIVYAYALGRTDFNFNNIGFYIPNPISSIEYLIDGIALVMPYMTIIVPVEIYNFIETMDNVEAANAAGDNYNVRNAQFADGICTMISALCGGVVPNTVWLGHAGLKKSGAGIGYSLFSGIVLGLSGILGLFTFLNHLVPASVCAITFIWCSVVMVSQAFKDTPTKHYAAVAIAMVPSVADFLYTQVTGAVSLSGKYPEIMSSGVADFSQSIYGKLIDAGVMWDGVAPTKSGAIIIGILLGTITAFIIDKRLDKVAIASAVGYLLSALGFIHSAQIVFNPTSPFAIGYLIIAVLSVIFHFARKTWFKAQDDFDYV